MEHGLITLTGGAHIANLRAEQLVSDPEVGDLFEGRLWYNVTEKKSKSFQNGVVVTFATGGDASALQIEVDKIETALGLTAAGDFDTAALASSNYLVGSTTQKETNTKLDVALKAVADSVAGTVTTQLEAIQTEVNQVEASVGLGADGTLAAFTGATVVSASTDLRSAVVALDTNAAALAAADLVLQTNIDGKVAKAGDTMAGNLAFGGNYTVTGLTAAADPTQPVRKAEFDAAIFGLDFQSDVLGTETDFVDVAGRYIYEDGTNFATGVAASAGDIVKVNAAGEILAVEYDVSVAGTGAIVFNRAANKWFNLFGTSWTATQGLESIVDGVGLKKEGNVLSVNLGAGVAQLPSDEVGIDVRANSGLFLTADGTADSTDTNAQLAVKLAAGLKVDAAGIAIDAKGVVAANLAADVIGTGLQGADGVAISVKAAEGIAVSATGVGLDLVFADARFAGKTVTETALQTLTDAIAAVNAKVAGSEFLFTAQSAAVEHTIVHGLGQRFAGVTVYNASGKVTVPSEIEAVDANTVKVTMPAASIITAMIRANKVA